jgi:hypothetical protein
MKTGAIIYVAGEKNSVEIPVKTCLYAWLRKIYFS